MEAEEIELKIGRKLRIDPIFRERQFVFDRNLVFVLMPFSEPWSERIWEKLKSIIESKHLRAERADNKCGAIIAEDIWKGIMESRLLICDTTGWNPNVFYELGIAHTIGKQVVLLTQPTHHLPFDTQGLRHLFYTDNPDGMRKLDEELPKWIDHCLSTSTGVGLTATGEKRHAKRVQRETHKMRVRDAWRFNTNDYDPPLPPLNHPALRVQLGAVKMRMMEYAWSFSGEDIERLVIDLKEVWPETWEELTAAEIIDKIDEIEEVVAKYRAEYRKRMTQ
jgi:hypothetical protein